MKIEEWLIQNNIDFEFVNKNDFKIPEIGLFHFIGYEHDNIFDEHCNFIIDTEYECDFLCFEFGGNYFYIPAGEQKKGPSFKGESQSIKLVMLKYLGKAKIECDYIDYINLGVRGSYELLNGSGLYSDYCKKAKFLGHKALGICEYNTLAGTIVFQSSCKDAEIKPIIGETVNLKISENVYRDIKLYVKNKKGWKNILRINSCINVFNESHFVTIEQLNQYSENLICCLGVDFDFSVLNKLNFNNEDLYVYIDVCEYKSSKKELEHLKQIKYYFDEISNKIKPVLICDTFYLDKDYSHVKKLLNLVGDIKFQNESNSQHYKNIDEILEFSKMFSDASYNEMFWNAIDNTKEIYEKCLDFEIDTKNMKLPKYALKEGEFHCKDSEELFIEKIKFGFDLKIKGKVENEQEYLERIDKEVDIIKRGGFIDYILILWDIMMFCQANGILTGTGRGSAGGSLISYLLEITQLDPIKYDLLFERFLNEGRFTSVPDIDCDFEGLRRDEVKRYMEYRFGIHLVASIGSYNKMKVKSGLKDIGRVMGYDHKNINIISSFIGDDLIAGDGIMQIFKTSQTNRTLKDFAKNNVDLINTIMILLNNHRSGSVHASGVLVVPNVDEEGNKMEIYDWLPVKKTSDGILITEWEGIYVDKCKFVKEDILGIAVMDKWSYTLKLIEEHTGEKLNIYRDVPVDDKETFEMFSLGYNDDVFQFGSDIQKQYSAEVKPNHIEHLIAMNALYRPGPLIFKAHIHFAKIKNGEQEPMVDTGMDRFTGATYGLWVYQEQIMQAYVYITGITLSEADEFRKFCVKVKWYKHLFATEYDKYHSKFINGYVEKVGVTEEYAQSVWDKIIAFAEYGFNRSHAAAYALTGYYSQYLKVHYPLQFWTSSLHYAREDEIHKRISEINKSSKDIRLMPPDINKSEYKFFADYETKNIYWSFDKIKYCGGTAIDVIIDERNKNGRFYSFEEFISRVPKKNVNKRTVVHLIMSGCFDEIENIINVQDRVNILKKHSKILKYDVDDVFLSEKAKHDFWWLLKQKEVCGFGYINYNKVLNKNGIKGLYMNETDFLLPNSKGKNVIFGGVINFINKRKTKHGDEFVELKIEVNSEMHYFTIWNDIYSELKKEIDNSIGKVILTNGLVDFNNWKGRNVLMSCQNTKIKFFEV